MEDAELKLILTQLALLHATSFHFLKRYPGGEEQFKKDYPVGDVRIRDPWFTSSRFQLPFQTLASETWLSQENKELADMMESMFETMDEVFLTTLKEFATDRPHLALR